MATNLGRRTDNRPPTRTSGYAAAPEPLQVPRTPLESRQGYHPKTDDRLVWKSPPSRQLTRQKRVEYESDVRERFYDDYIGNRTTGDARNEVMTTTELAKLKFDPRYYKINAYQGLAYDPMRRVPAGLDFNRAVQEEKMREKQRQTRQRRLSEPSIGSRFGDSHHYQDHDQYVPVQQRGSGPSIFPPLKTERPRSALQQAVDEVIPPDMVPGVEDWLLNASKKDQEVAAGFFRTLSSHGQRPDPASKAALHRTRVRSAVMTPSRKNRQDQLATQNAFQQLSRETAMMEKQSKRQSEPSKRQQLKRSNSEKGSAKGSMFSAAKQFPSHFTVHPDWASESVGHSKK